MPGEKKRIVFICDASGTMINRLSLLHEELLQHVAALPEDHSYNILFFGDRGDFRALDRWKMVAPGAESRIATKQFLERITPWGTTNPIPAIEHAIKFRPDVIHFFSDGEFNSQAEYASVIEAFAAAHRDHATIVNTYLFESLDLDAETTMKKIAKDNKGTLKSISPAGFRSP
ncbi:vWA domain-containing protein [Humisphaera borealis]|uniref:VWA domain-containing protein n=1 Tax=Humisphaera borealis TaxID=2807512 RepID=A0A7M2X1S9_9BACT|nr:hypothetical protein [Humisphaera borealis]QOV91698.1 hypothetical protein IPV69_10170 [Humisphaera borealis]